MKFRLNRSLLIKLMLVVFGVVFVGALFMLLRSWEEQKSRVTLPELDRDAITWKGVEYTQRKDLDTVLIMGLDKFDEDQIPGRYINRQQADFLLLAAIDRRDKAYSILHLNRDTMTKMSILGDRGKRVDTVTGQLALAHTYGTGSRDSCRNTAEAVSNLLHGVKIDHYLSMTMDAVAILNDYSGGVTVEILDDFSGIDPTLVQGKTQTLKGQQALTYVRTRRGLDDSTNLHRMERQRQYLTALREQMTAKGKEDPDFSAKALNKVAEYIVSDVTVNQLSAISEHLENYTFTGFSFLDGEAVKGEEYMEFYPDEEALMETVLELYFKPKE